MEIDNRDIITMKEKYPAFKILEHEKKYIFTGKLDLDHIFNDVRMTGKFNLEITVFSDCSSPIPVVKEVSNRIDRNYPHRYNDGQLCLASDFELKMYFSQNTDISSFVDMYIIPYIEWQASPPKISPPNTNCFHYLFFIPHHHQLPSKLYHNHGGVIYTIGC